MCIENLPGDHTEKPCPLDWLNRWGIPVGGKDTVLGCHHSIIGKGYWSKIPAHQQHFCQCQLTGSLQLEEDMKLLHYHVQELYLEEEES